MEEIKSRYSTRESFISELAFAMSDHDIHEEQYLNLTQQNLSVILREDYSWGRNGLRRAMKLFLWTRLLHGRHFI